MLLWNTILRFTASLVFVKMCYTYNSNGEATKERPLSKSKYPIQVYNMYKEQLQKKTSKVIGEWSAWSPWSSCSRSCGGGITQQTRNCITRPTDSRFTKKQRRRRQNGKSAQGCVGLYKRIRLCNSQECPSSQDFRHEQCTAFNNRLFRGVRYQWEPFLKVKDECALNCRAVGMTFFATLNKTVIDGTSCTYPVTHTGKTAPKGSKGVCIEGYCKVVNSHGVIGSLDADQENCAACLKGSCRSINGIYTMPDLPPGYSLVAQIPSGACKVFIQQIKHSRNFLALKITNGSYIVNGDWKFSTSRVIHGAGTKFVYVRQDDNSLETISSPGPLANSVDILIVNYQTNPGIKYSYSLPLSETPHIAPPSIKRTVESRIEPTVLETRRLEPQFNVSSHQKDEAVRSVPSSSLHKRTRTRKRHFHWKITGLTACSKSCGGGIQTYVRTCIRDLGGHNQIPVHDRRCSHLESSPPSPIRCNAEPCPPAWDFRWTDCSVTCGEGIQEYVPECKQDLVSGMVPVSESLCSKPKPKSQTRSCRKPTCENISDNELTQVIKESKGTNDWSVENWSQCSVTCGTGHRTRLIACPSGRCRSEDRPAHAEYCNMGPCTAPPSTITSLSQTSHSTSAWLITDWSHCSETCGTGKQKRYVMCGLQDQEKCQDSEKPDQSRACSSEKECGGQWFVGPWGACSDSCIDRPRQKRDVYCVIKIRGQPHITNEMTCSTQLKPYEEQSCAGVCPPHWYMGEWGPCEGNCPTGVQKRHVKCLDIRENPSDQCIKEDMPISKRSCTCQSKEDSRDVDRYQPRDQPVERSCVDRIRKCKVAVQARLCHYHYYIVHCCESCRKAQDPLE